MATCKTVQVLVQNNVYADVHFPYMRTCIFRIRRCALCVYVRVHHGVQRGVHRVCIAECALLCIRLCTLAYSWLCKIPYKQAWIFVQVSVELRIVFCAVLCIGQHEIFRIDACAIKRISHCAIICIMRCADFSVQATVQNYIKFLFCLPIMPKQNLTKHSL